MDKDLSKRGKIYVKANIVFETFAQQLVDSQEEKEEHQAITSQEKDGLTIIFKKNSKVEIHKKKCHQPKKHP